MDQLDLQNIDRWVLDEDLSPWEGKAFTILDDGQPVGISGFVLENGIGGGWLVGSKKLREHPVYLHRTMKKVLRELLQNPAIKYICAEAEDYVTARWLERLGFKRERHRLSETKNKMIFNYVLKDM